MTTEERTKEIIKLQGLGCSYDEAVRRVDEWIQLVEQERVHKKQAELDSLKAPLKNNRIGLWGVIIGGIGVIVAVIQLLCK